MKRWTLLLLIIIAQVTHAQQYNNAIGQWREYLSNYSVTQLVQGDLIYGASNNQVFTIDSLNQLDFYGKSNGLHATEVNQIAWDAINEQLIIGYKNGMIDIKQGDQVFLINDIALSKLYPSKTINNISISDNYAWVATNFGIVVIDLIKHEIKDTWFPNNSRQATPTYQAIRYSDSLFVTTATGIWRSPLKNNFVSGNDWTQLNSFDKVAIKSIFVLNNKLLLYNDNALFQYPNTTAIFNTAATISKLSKNNNKELLILLKKDFESEVVKLNPDNSTTSFIGKGTITSPADLLFTSTGWLLADKVNGILSQTNSIQEWKNLKGPRAAINGAVSLLEDKLVIAYGNNSPGFSVYAPTGWKYYSGIQKTILPAFTSSAIDPLTKSIWTVAANKIYQFTNDNQTVDSLQLVNKENIQDLQFDPSATGWLVQDKTGLYLQENNNWKLVSAPAVYNFTGIQPNLTINKGQAWMIAPNKQGIYIYQSNKVFASSIWQQKTTSSANGNLPSNNVTSLAADKEGAIWVGTDNGIGIFQCNDIAQESCNAFVPIVNSNGFNGYLFQRETVHCIAVDGANRKWIGTNNGAWLLSRDGYTIINHFTKENSPLFNDTVLQIKIAPNTGEVFFISGGQMTSYTGTATEGSSTQNEITIFPNPVPADFSGFIALRGIVNNGIIKITDLNGKLVFQTRALGGQAVWDGRTYEGQRIATGIYLVFVRDDTGNEKGVGKIAFIGGK